NNNSKNETEKYACICALGFCGGEKSIIELEKLLDDEKNSVLLKRISVEALFKLYNTEKQEELKNKILENLSNDLKLAIKQDEANLLKANLYTYLSSNEYQKFNILYDLYLLDTEVIREVLFDFLSNCPLTPNYFKQIRYIFKASEYRRDAKFFGLLSYRFEKEKEVFSFNSYSWSNNIDINTFNLDDNIKKELKRENIKNYTEWNNATYIKSDNIKKELKTEKSRFSYSNKTRLYLKKRVTRTLKELGENNDNDYVKMAVGVLLNYKDSDKEELKIRDSYEYDYESDNYAKIITNYTAYDIFAKYLTLNHILYNNSDRYTLKQNNKAFSLILKKLSDRKTEEELKIEIINLLKSENYKKNYENKREEWFPELWNKNPAGLIHLLIESECEIVHDFASKALFENKEIWSEIDIETLLEMLKKKYESTLKVSFEIAKEQYNNTNSDEIVKALALCNYEVARKQAFKWIDKDIAKFKGNSNFILALLLSDFSDTREKAKNLLSISTLEEKEMKVLIAKIVANMFLLKEDEVEKAKDLTDALRIIFPDLLLGLGISIIEDLLKHKIERIQLFGCYVFNNRELKPKEIPQNIIDAMINSEYESVREYAIKILSKLSDDSLILKHELILAFCTNKLADIRKSIKPLLMRLIKHQKPSNSFGNYDTYNTSYSDPEEEQKLKDNYEKDNGIKNRAFGEIITRDLFLFLQTKNSDKELLKDVCNLIENELNDFMYVLDKEIVLDVLESKNAETQDLCGKILQKNIVWSEDLKLLDIVKFSHHEIKSIREASWKMILHIKESILNSEENMNKIIRFFDSKQEDTRKFACNEFSKHFYENSWSAEFLINLCDSIYNDVRFFARNSIMTYFKQKDGQTYLIKLSEHPSKDIQLFATNYLEAYASDNIERLKELNPYFKRVLANVNRARMSKNRILTFLQKESLRNLESANIVSEILSWYSATVAISDKAKSIETLLFLQEKYPELHSSVKLKYPEVRLLTNQIV
ncbi:MAG: hypothetical protein AABZ74_02410, partial [Cyanobacteriota bacterium]